MEFKSNVPIYLQVIWDLERKMIIGELAKGEKLPSSRELAVMYQINPNTAARVYNEMELMELSFTKRGIGTFVTESEERIMQARKDYISQKVADFIDGIAMLGISKEELLSLVSENYENRKED